MQVSARERQSGGSIRTCTTVGVRIMLVTESERGLYPSWIILLAGLKLIRTIVGYRERRDLLPPTEVQV